MRERDSLWKSTDWFVIVLYLALITLGWLSICGASFSFEETNLYDFSTRTGKQLVWIVCSLGLAFVIMMLDDNLYDAFAYVVYGAILVLLVVTIFIAPDTKGSRSWLILGPVSLQPAEFAKFATALALAKFMSGFNFVLQNRNSFLAACAIFLVPMFLIVMQKETGSALVYLAFFLVLYREGMSGVFLFVAICMVVYFVVGIKFADVPLGQTPTMVGQFVVLLLILLFTGMLVLIYTRYDRLGRNVVLGTLLVVGLACLISLNGHPFNIVWVEWALCALVAGYLLYQGIRFNKHNCLYIALFAIGSVAFLYSTDYVFNQALEPHQQMRIKVTLGLEEDPRGAGYNVNQSKIAIGSGGLKGKGFLNGTQTKLKFVPEQDTDFIFCTIGEEQGFIGSTFVLILYLVFILRLLYMAERQPTTFGRVYGYSVLSIFLFHVFINIGMVLGITPVIGIPLPFFSYGGSSLWGFTILLFIFIRIDAGRYRRLL